jgi:hypothetical protein
MTAGKWDITIEQGAALLQTYLIQDINGNTLDLTGCTAALQVRCSLGNPTALLTLTTENGGLVIDGPNGTITPVVEITVLNALIPDVYVYDLKLYASGGDPLRLLEGNVYVVAGATLI